MVDSQVSLAYAPSAALEGYGGGLTTGAGASTPATPAAGAASPSPSATGALMRKIFLLLGIVFLAAAAFGQTSNTLYARDFPGSTIGAKVTAAQDACNANTALKCVIVIDSGLAAYPTGTMPAPCANCVWWDLRQGTQFPGLKLTTSGTSGAATLAQGVLNVPQYGGACEEYKGVVNVLDCGAVADGAFVPGGCGETSPSGCWTGTDDYNAITQAVAVAASDGGGKIYFPPAGTNVWMVGSSSECVSTVPDTSQSALFSLPNGVEIEGAGENETVIMAEPQTGSAANCWMFTNGAVPAYNLAFHNVRLDGNEITDATHYDSQHPDNGGAGAGFAGMGAIAIIPNTRVGAMNDIPSARLSNVAITGFQGAKEPVAGTPSGIQFALWFGADNQVLVENTSIYNNEWAAAILNQSPDSTFSRIYMNRDADWNPWPTVVDLDSGADTWVDNYWGGGGGANYLGLGVQNDTFVGNVNDYPGAGVTWNCSATIFGCGSNFIFAASSDRGSANDSIVGGSATDTAASFPAVLIAGTSSYPSSDVSISNVRFNSIGPVPSYLVSEEGSVSSTDFVNNIVDETPSAGDFNFVSSSSYAAGNSGAPSVGTYQLSSGNLTDGSVIEKSCGTATFSASTSAPPISCSWVTSASHCALAWSGGAEAATLGYTVAAGAVTAVASAASTGTAAVSCSGD